MTGGVADALLRIARTRKRRSMRHTCRSVRRVGHTTSPTNRVAPFTVLDCPGPEALQGLLGGGRFVEELETTIMENSDSLDLVKARIAVGPRLKRRAS